MLSRAQIPVTPGMTDLQKGFALPRPPRGTSTGSLLPTRSHPPTYSR